MNIFDRAISTVFPPWAKWAYQRDILVHNKYEAAQPGRNRKAPKETASGNVAVEMSATSLRQQARGLDQNHDVARGILNSLVNKVVGPKGIGVEFMPKTLAGDPMPELASQLSEAFDRWSHRPEVTGAFNRSRAERLMCRSWLRDGEVFVKLLSGNVKSLRHATKTQLSFEMLEADFVPIDLTQEKKKILQGIEINGWGRKMAYHVLKSHPGDMGMYSMDTKRVPAEKMLHASMCDRIHQLRGVSIFSSVLTRLQDIKDYEESERVAARIAAAMAAYIRKGDPSMYNNQTDNSDRTIKMAPGLIFDNLRPGEEIGTISHNRPNSQLGGFRADMLKAVAAGTGSQYSTISKNYDGTYSSQRQELIEQQSNYLTLTDEFIDQITEPLVYAFLKMAILNIDLPAETDRESLYNVEFQGPSMPWIDPVKEANGYMQLVRNGFTSKAKVIRSLGGTPQRISQQIEQERTTDDSKALVFTSDAKHGVQK